MQQTTIWRFIVRASLLVYVRPVTLLDSVAALGAPVGVVAELVALRTPSRRLGTNDTTWPGRAPRQGECPCPGEFLPGLVRPGAFTNDKEKTMSTQPGALLVGQAAATIPNKQDPPRTQGHLAGMIRSVGDDAQARRTLLTRLEGLGVRLGAEALPPSEAKPGGQAVDATAQNVAGLLAILEQLLIDSRDTSAQCCALLDNIEQMV